MLGYGYDYDLALVTLYCCSGSVCALACLGLVKVRVIWRQMVSLSIFVFFFVYSYSALKNGYFFVVGQVGR